MVLDGNLIISLEEAFKMLSEYYPDGNVRVTKSGGGPWEVVTVDDTWYTVYTDHKTWEDAFSYVFNCNVVAKK